MHQTAIQSKRIAFNSPLKNIATLSHQHLFFMKGGICQNDYGLTVSFKKGTVFGASFLKAVV